MATTAPSGTPRVLLTGVTGYVGGRLLAPLEARPLRLRCLARRPEYVRPRVRPTTEVVGGDVLDPATLGPALEGVDTCYYLIHSMGAEPGFEERDRRGARGFAEAARQAGVRRIVYLGGLGGDAHLSPHLGSRHEVGRILRGSGVPTLELRSSIIIGSGSLSFELIRALVERLPVMITPRWVRTRTQPIGIEDVIDYLIGCLDLEAAGSRVYEIGGPDTGSYGDLMLAYAAERGLRRWIVPVPVLTPGLSSLWLRLVTPVYAPVGRSLIESIRHETLVRDRTALEHFAVRPRGYREAIRRALAGEERELAASRWSDATSSLGEAPARGGRRHATRLVDERSARVAVDPARCFRPVRRIGGHRGWYHADWLWRLRGILDLLLGGPGLRRGRRDPERLRPGDALDFWRVEAYEPDRLLRLKAEMRLPGRAWLEFRVEPEGEGCSRLHQTAIFDPAGLPGLAYWYAVHPLHRRVFQGMLDAIVRLAQEPESPGAATVRPRGRGAAPGEDRSGSPGSGP